MTAPLASPPQLPPGAVPALSAPSPAGNLANLFPVVTPAPTTPAAPAAPAAGRAHREPTGASVSAATALTADIGVLGARPGRLIALLLTLAAGIAALGIWFAAAEPARSMVGSLARRRGRRTR